MFTQLFNRRLQIEREARLLSFAGEVKLDTSNIDPNAAAKLAENGETKDAKEQLTPEQVQKQRVEEAVKAANDTIARHNDFAAKLSPDMQKAMRTELGSFMATTIESHDRNGVAGLNKAEFDAYKANAKNEIDALFTSMGSQSAEAQKKAEQEAKTASTVAEKSAGEGELKGKTFEQIEAELTGKKLDSVEAIAAIELTSENPAELQKQLAVYQQNVQDVNAAQDAIQQRGTLVGAFHGKATEQMKAISDAANAAGASGSVAAGAAVGAAIGVWGFGVGAFVGAGIGAVGGAIAYGVGRGIAAAAQYKEKQALAARANALVNSERASLTAARAKVGGEGIALAKQGTQVNAAPEALRAKTDAKTTAETQKVADLSARTAAEQQATTEKVAEIENAIGRSDETGKKIEQLKQEAEAEASAGNPEALDAVAQIRTKAEELADQRSAMDEARGALSVKLSDFDTFLGELASTDKTIRETAEGDHARLDALDADLGGDVLVANVRTLQAQEGLNEEGKQLAALQTVTPEAFFSSTTWTSGFDGFAAGTKWLLKDTIAAALDKASIWLKEVPVIGGLGYSLDIASGVIEGVADMGEGIATLLGHPVQTATGLVTMLSTPEGWRKFGESLISYEDFANGRIGKGIGKLGLNILTTATGVGAVGKGAQAARIAFAGTKNLMPAIVKATYVGARVGASELVAGTVRIPGNIVAGARNIGRTVKNLGSSKLTAATNAITSATDDIGRSTKALKPFDDIKALVGENADELAKMGGKELAALGISDARSIGRFLRYRDLMKQNASLNAARKAAEAAKVLEQTSPGLSRLQQLEADLARSIAKGDDAAKAKALSAMDELLEQTNATMKESAGDISDVIHAGDNYVLGVGKSGKLELLTNPADLTRWIDNTATFGGKSPIDVRMNVAERVLGRTLSKKEMAAVKSAHEIEGFGTVAEGKITKPQLRQKYATVKESFTEEYMAKGIPEKIAKKLAAKDADTLMRRGVTGEPEISVARPKERISRWDSDVDYSEVEYRDGQEIEVFYMKNGDTVEQVLDDAAKRPTMTFQDDFDDLDLDLDESSFARRPVTADDLGDGLDDAVGGAPDSVASFDPDRLPPAKKTTQQPPVLEYVDDVDEMPSSVVRLDDVDNVLDDVAERADGAGSSVTMSADPTDVDDIFSDLRQRIKASPTPRRLVELRTQYAQELNMQPGKSYRLDLGNGRGLDHGWVYDSVDGDGMLVFKKEGKTMTMRPERQTTSVPTVKVNRPAPGSSQVVPDSPVQPIEPVQPPRYTKIKGEYASALDFHTKEGLLPGVRHIAAAFEPAVWKEVAESMWNGEFAKHGWDLFKKELVQDAKNITYVRKVVGDVSAKVTPAITPKPRRLTPKPKLYERFADAVDARDGQSFKRIKSVLEMAIGRDPLRMQFKTLRSNQRNIVYADRRIQKLQKKLDAKPRTARANKLREQIKDIQSQRETYKKDAKSLRTDLRLDKPKQAPPAANPNVAPTSPASGFDPKVTIDPATLPAAPADLSRWIAAAAASTGNDASVVRQKVAEAILGRGDLSDIELLSIEYSHGIEGFGKIGRKTANKKFRPLVAGFQEAYMKKGFGRKEAFALAMEDADELIRRGVTGTAQKMPSFANISTLKAPPALPKPPARTVSVAPTPSASAAPTKTPPPPPKAPSSVTNAPKLPPPPLNLPDGYKIQGRSLVDAKGNILPPRDYEVLGVMSQNEKMGVLTYKEGKEFVRVEVPVVELNKIPVPKPGPTPGVVSPKPAAPAAPTKGPPPPPPMRKPSAAALSSAPAQAPAVVAAPKKGPPPPPGKPSSKPAAAPATQPVAPLTSKPAAAPTTKPQPASAPSLKPAPSVAKPSAVPTSKPQPTAAPTSKPAPAVTKPAVTPVVQKAPNVAPSVSKFKPNDIVEVYEYIRDMDGKKLDTGAQFTFVGPDPDNPASVQLRVNNGPNKGAIRVVSADQLRDFSHGAKPRRYLSSIDSAVRDGVISKLKSKLKPGEKIGDFTYERFEPKKQSWFLSTPDEAYVFTDANGATVRLPEKQLAELLDLDPGLERSILLEMIYEPTTQQFNLNRKYYDLVNQRHAEF